MAFKLAVVCASAFLVQTITASSCNLNNGLNSPYNNLNANAFSNSNANAFSNSNTNAFGNSNAFSSSNSNAFSSSNNNAINNFAINNIASNNANNLGNAISNSGFSTSFPVSSQTQVLPGSVSIQSDVVIEGPLEVVGRLPFLGAVALEGKVPTNGQGSVAYASGNADVGIVSEAVPAASSYVETGLNYGSGYNAPIYVY